MASRNGAWVGIVSSLSRVVVINASVCFGGSVCGGHWKISLWMESGVRRVGLGGRFMGCFVLALVRAWDLVGTVPSFVGMTWEISCWMLDWSGRGGGLVGSLGIGGRFNVEGVSV